jgi:hypothetical protein
MKTITRRERYRPTESKYKGGAHEMYVTYDLEQKTRGGGSAMYPKIKRVYIAGDLKDWKRGAFKKRSGRSFSDQSGKVRYYEGTPIPTSIVIVALRDRLLAKLC